ncbi:MAG: CRISPR-associated endonuclease/helicase Cas3 [Desulfonauticus sp.]|nr:CRISPR-associated endonuclease/helicase Cas3 [Desulfonauticus sp.]
MTLFDKKADFSKYYAHSSKEKEKEPFVEHAERTLKYWKKINQLWETENLFRSLLISLLPKEDVDSVFDILGEIVRWHDLGKLTFDFQKKLDGEENNTTHSDKSFVTLLYLLALKLDNQELSKKSFILLTILLYSVYKHHGSLNNVVLDLQEMRFNKTDKEQIKHILSVLGIEIAEGDSIFEALFNGIFCKNLSKTFEAQSSKDLLNNFDMYTLLKLFHSTLISADYFATMEYHRGEEFAFNVIDKKLFDNAWNSFHSVEKINGKHNFNPAIKKEYDELKNIEIEHIEINNSKSEALNKVRSWLNVRAEENLKSNFNNQSNVYFLNIPTGGGKTNISLRLALRIIKEKKNIKKLFYVFPFINLIDQSYDYIAGFWGQYNVARLDSQFIPQNNKEDDDYSFAYARYIDQLFFNKPVLFLSHVKFFDLFLRNAKEPNYNFYQLSNSVVIIDEIQAYNDKVWTEVITLLNEVGKRLNTYFIVMSATLPQLEDLLENESKNIVYLFNNDLREQIFNHEVFKRTRIKVNIKNLKKDNLIEKMDNFIQKDQNIKKILIVFNTVKDSREFFEEIKNKFDGFKKLLLNSTILKDKRERIIKESKDDTRMILVSTQSVEAGVDIDFDLGFREYAPLDSIMQVAGRINRNNKKNICDLYVFNDERENNLNTSTMVYRGVKKGKITKEIREYCKNIEDIEISENSVEEYFANIVGEIKKQNKNIFVENSAENIKDMKTLYFKNIDGKIRLIEGDNISLFIPYDDNGKKLWEEYVSLFESSENDPIKRTIEIKNKQRKLIPYVINIFNSWINGKIKMGALLKSEIQYGFYYCNDWRKYYDIEKGLDLEKFKEQKIGREFEII